MSNSVSLSSSVWHSLSLRSLVELISWDSPLKLSPPLSSSSGGRLFYNIASIKTNHFTFAQCGSCSRLCSSHRCHLCCDQRKKQKRTSSSKCLQVSFTSCIQDRFFSKQKTFYQIDREMHGWYIFLFHCNALCDTSMGTAVAHGGVSTLLAFILVAFSNSYVYLTFFKVFSYVYLKFFKVFSYVYLTFFKVFR